MVLLLLSIDRCRIRLIARMIAKQYLLKQTNRPKRKKQSVNDNICLFVFGFMLRQIWRKLLSAMYIIVIDVRCYAKIQSNRFQTEISSWYQQMHTIEVFNNYLIAMRRNFSKAYAYILDASTMISILWGNRIETNHFDRECIGIIIIILVIIGQQYANG